jgi:hypothetical protein
MINNSTDILSVFRFTPESIRWYMTHDKIEKAEGELRDIARMNRKEYPEETLKIPATSTKNLSFLSLFSTSTLAIGALIQAFAW